MSNLKIIGIIIILLLVLSIIHYLLLPLKIVLMMIGSIKYLVLAIAGFFRWLLASIMSGNIMTIAITAFAALVIAGGIVRARKESRLR